MPLLFYKILTYKCQIKNLKEINNMSKKITNKISAINPKNLPKTKLDDVLNLRALSYAVGTLWGLVMLVVTILSLNTGYGEEFLLSMTSIYVGYDISITGSINGFLYGFLDGFVGTYLLVYIYRFFDKFSKFSIK